MINATRDLTEASLKKNFGYWLRKLRVRKSVVHPWDMAFKIPSTHTFGAWRKWGEGEDAQDFPYDQILFRDRGLISDYHRRKRIRRGLKTPYRKMSKAKRVKLDRFVFAYFGVHDPYYARSGEIDVAAFGIFIQTDLERFPKCNATRRDLSSAEAEWPPDREFLLPIDARIIAKQQVASEKHHKDDFWHYWGNEQYFMDPGYANEHWSWKTELHFFERVDVKHMDAVLWPYELRGRLNDWGGRRRYFIGGDAANQFKKFHPSCQVIPYHWSNAKPTLSLVKASGAVSRFLVVKGRYPDSADDAVEYFRP
jgi:hypothetical protein